MFGLGPIELVVIFVLALLVLGPEKIPTAAAQLGKAIRSFRKASQDLKDQLDTQGQIGKTLGELQSAIEGTSLPIHIEEEQHPISKPLLITMDEQQLGEQAKHEKVPGDVNGSKDGR